MIRDITKLDKELFHNFVSLAPQDFLSAFVKIIFWFIINTFQLAYIKLNLFGAFI